MIRRFRFLYCIGADDGSPVKLGVCGDVFGRLHNVQGHNWQTLRIHWVVEGDEDDEAELHRRFQDRHIRGEFYANEDGVVSGLYRSILLPDDLSAERCSLLRSIGGKRAYDRSELAAPLPWWGFWFAARMVHMPEIMRPAIEQMAAGRGVVLPHGLFLPALERGAA